MNECLHHYRGFRSNTRVLTCNCGGWTMMTRNVVFFITSIMCSRIINFRLCQFFSYRQWAVGFSTYNRCLKMILLLFDQNNELFTLTCSENLNRTCSCHHHLYYYIQNLLMQLLSKRSVIVKPILVFTSLSNMCMSLI